MLNAFTAICFVIVGGFVLIWFAKIAWAWLGIIADKIGYFTAGDRLEYLKKRSGKSFLG